jgi:ATP-dependent helicase HrpA
VVPKIDFPQALPVSLRREEIMQAIQDHPVVIVSGETGSGKTTQLPKMCLALGRARMNAKPGQRPMLIGHTQPRRIAATSVAKRISDELGAPLGEVVGYKVRFNDQLGPNASIKLMTDGILLAETQGDPLLRAYDTIIIDEAHERSLNIDFLLGYLKEILPRRPDLKIIVTSATIDSERFSNHFASIKGPAPIIKVSGRTFPVEIRYRPFEESRDHGLNEAIAQALDELWINPLEGGDVLVFLPGEREIRDAADHLREHLKRSVSTASAEVLPLFARLTQAEQDRIFAPHRERRVVLATNVAETSLTVPGIRFVIDSGLARIKRYSFRSKVEQLLVEPISKAAANQRAGRCGRVSDGVCIRLFEQQDFDARAPFTDPEILRSSLAGVILRMKALHLGDVERFSFLEPPRPKAISDGYQLLNELGAVDEQHILTPLGHELSRLPLDPKVGRMILEAQKRQCLEEVLIIASALSVQDVRDRPLSAQAQADQQHAKFKDDRSEFTGYLTLWNWIRAARGEHPHGQQAPNSKLALANTQSKQAAKGAERQSQLAVQAKSLKPSPQNSKGSSPNAFQPRTQEVVQPRLSNRQFESLLKQNFINPRRLREWRDVYTQLLSVAKEMHMKLNTKAASYENLHKSLLSGLLGNIGFKPEDEDVYLGARGIKFYKYPGAHLRKKPGRWIVASEIVETTRVFGRGIANIDPTWIEEVGAHLLKRQMLDPHWEKRSGEVNALERATLYGLVVYSGRRVPYARVDMGHARQIFIREGLVPPQLETKLGFLSANLKLIKEVEDIEHKSRRQDVLVDDEMIYAFYDERIPQDVYSSQTLEAWYKAQERKMKEAGETSTLLLMTREALMRHEAKGVTHIAFPPTLKMGGVDCKVEYLHEPGHPRDGMSVGLPIFVLNQVSDERAEWLVPGMLKEKVLALLKTLPQRPRSRLVPLPQSAERLCARLSEPQVFAHGSLMQRLCALIKEDIELAVSPQDFKPDMLSAHLLCHFVLMGEGNRMLAQGRHLAQLKSQFGAQARGAFQALASLKVDGPSQAQRADSKTPKAAGVQPQLNPPSGPSQALKAQGSTANAARDEADQKYTRWSFGELPELMEIRKGTQSLVGFPALMDQVDAVSLEVFDELEMAQEHHQKGLKRLVALQLKEPIKYLQKNLNDLGKMNLLYLQLYPKASSDELFTHILDVAMERAFLMEPTPRDAESFDSRVQEGRTRLQLIAQEVAKVLLGILTEAQAAKKKLKDLRSPKVLEADVLGQLERLIPQGFVLQTPYAQWVHLPRYLRAIQLRLEKYKADPKRDETRRLEISPMEQKFWRFVAQRKGHLDKATQDFRWLLEELRVSSFAQELKTPQPVSVKRLEKAWALLNQ